MQSPAGSFISPQGKFSEKVNQGKDSEEVVSPFIEATLEEESINLFPNTLKYWDTG